MGCVHKPIFIVGTGRCGSTVFHRILAEHSEVAFFTAVIARYPAKLHWQRAVMGWWDSPVLGRILRYRLRPSEAWRFWDYHVPGFSKPFRDLRDCDVTVNTKATLYQTLSRIITRQRSRLLVKLTGWTRVGFIKEVFPDAKIIHIIREPWSVVNSLLHVPWWRGWEGPEKWRWGPLSAEEEQLWKLYNESFLVLAAIQWKKVMEAYYTSLNYLSEEKRKDVIEVYYRDLCSAESQVMENILTFCDLPYTNSFRQSLLKYNLESQDNKWQKDLTVSQQKQLEKALEELHWRRYIHHKVSQLSL
jgi:hypothetical protein